MCHKTSHCHLVSILSLLPLADKCKAIVLQDQLTKTSIMSAAAATDYSFSSLLSALLVKGYMYTAAAGTHSASFSSWKNETVTADYHAYV